MISEESHAREDSMGGYGSGRHWNTQSTTEDFRQIDIRWLSRQEGFAEGRSASITWSRHGQNMASIRYEVGEDAITLIYRSRERGSDQWEDYSYPVRLERQQCHFGGHRLWFRCPVLSCQRRCAVLYGGAIFACRACRKIRYPSQGQTISGRATERAWALLKRLDADWYMTIFESGPERPKGMHRKTFEGLARRYEEARLVALSDAPSGYF